MTDKKVQSDFYDKDYFVPREYSYEVVRVCHSGDVVHYSVDDINDIKMNYAYLVFYCGD